MTSFKLFLLLISFLAHALISSSVPLRGLSKGDYIPCALTFNVKTLPNGGTTSNVSFTLIYRWGNRPVVIPNLVDWNLLPQPPGHVFFQDGQLDHLAGAVDCDPFTRLLCAISITISGTGQRPNWGCEYIVVASPEVGIKNFTVNQWLDESNNYTYVASTICPRFSFSKGMTGGTKGSLAI